MVTPDPAARRIALAGAGTAAGLALLFAYPTSLNRSPAAPGTPVAGGTNATGGSSATGGTGSNGGSSATGGSTSSGSAGGTFTGDAVDTEWGPVQIEITVQNHKIVSVRPLQIPANNSRDVEINDYAVPILMQETVQASSADIDAVSGATVTSGGYISSLQSAIDKAHL